MTAGAGMRYVGSTRSLALNGTNLADKTCIGNCTYGCFYGEPRRVIGSVSYRW